MKVLVWVHFVLGWVFPSLAWKFYMQGIQFLAYMAYMCALTAVGLVFHAVRLVKAGRR